MVSPTELYDRFESVVGRAPGRILVRSRTAKTSASELLNEIRSTARVLSGLGLSPGDLVLLAGARGLQFIVGSLATWSCGAPLIAADPQLRGPELDELRKTFAPCVTILGMEGHLLAEREHDRAEGVVAPEGVAVFKLTSGSTGKPRGIAVTAAQLLADAEHIIEDMDVRPDDVNIAAIPLSHSYGMGNVLMPLVVQGSPVHLVPEPLPELLVEALSIEEPAIFPGVPYLFEMVARSDGPAFRRRGLRTCISAGAPLRARTAVAFRERYGLPVRAFYGASETGGITYDRSREGDAAVAGDGCVGTRMSGVEVILEGDESRVVVRGPSVASKYVGIEDESGGGEFVDGCFRTGDTARFDEGGRLHLTGRVGTLINVSGRKVNPREVERALASLEGVDDVAVIAVADASRGEALVACLVVEHGVTRERVSAHLRESLAPYKHPRRILFLPELPRSPRGKLDHEALRREASGSRFQE